MLTPTLMLTLHLRNDVFYCLYKGEAGFSEMLASLTPTPTHLKFQKLTFICWVLRDDYAMTTWLNDAAQVPPGPLITVKHGQLSH